MTDHMNFERLSHVSPPHTWTAKTTLQQAGFVFKKEKILCAAPNATGTFWAPGASDQAFQARLDGRDRVVERTWTPITKQEHELLKKPLESRTGEPHLLFAWMPLPVQREEVPSSPSVSSDSKLELATDLDSDDKAAEKADVPVEMETEETGKLAAASSTASDAPLETPEKQGSTKGKGKTRK